MTQVAAPVSSLLQPRENSPAESSPMLQPRVMDPVQASPLLQPRMKNPAQASPMLQPRAIDARGSFGVSPYVSTYNPPIGTSPYELPYAWTPETCPICSQIPKEQR